MTAKLSGERNKISQGDELYPKAFFRLKDPPEAIYAIGNTEALEEGLAVVGARLATPYGISCATKFSRIASENGITIISGGARGCDSTAHRAALSANGKTVVFLGGGCDELYPKENARLFQEIIDRGGVVVSEHSWEEPPLPPYFRLRNRLIASLSKATLIVEAGLPSGTFSTADEALAAGREVLVVPGSITSKNSHGANRLLCQGAIPIVDTETFLDQLRTIFNVVVLDEPKAVKKGSSKQKDIETLLFEMVSAEPCSSEKMLEFLDRKRKGTDNMVWLMQWLSEMQRHGSIARYPNGTYGPAVV